MVLPEKESNQLDEDAPTSFLGKQLTRFSIGNQRVSAWILSKMSLVLLILTYLEVKDISVSMIDAGIVFCLILIGTWFSGYIDDYLRLTYKELTEHGKRFSPWWSPTDGYYGVKFLQMEQDIQVIKQQILIKQSSTKPTLITLPPIAAS